MKWSHQVFQRTQRFPVLRGYLIAGEMSAVNDDVATGAPDIRNKAVITGENEAVQRGVTGTSGKTTTKEMTAAVAGRRWKVHRNRGNFNNLIGLPLTVLELDAGHQVAVLEMGMNRRGEIRRLAEIGYRDAEAREAELAEFFRNE